MNSNEKSFQMRNNMKNYRGIWILFRILIKLVLFCLVCFFSVCLCGVIVSVWSCFMVLHELYSLIPNPRQEVRNLQESFIISGNILLTPVSSFWLILSYLTQNVWTLWKMAILWNWPVLTERWKHIPESASLSLYIAAS